MIRPEFNHCLVEIDDEYGAVLRSTDSDQYQKGKLVNYNLMPQHITASSSHDISAEDSAKYKTWLDSLMGKIVYWGQYAESGQVFEQDGKKYALIPFYKIVGSEA